MQTVFACFRWWQRSWRCRSFCRSWPGSPRRDDGWGVVVVGGTDERQQRRLAGLLRAVRLLDCACARHLSDGLVGTLAVVLARRGAESRDVPRRWPRRGPRCSSPLPACSAARAWARPWPSPSCSRSRPRSGRRTGPAHHRYFPGHLAAHLRRTALLGRVRHPRVRPTADRSRGHRRRGQPARPRPGVRPRAAPGAG